MRLANRCFEKSREQTMILLVMIGIIDFFMIVVATEPTAVVNTTSGPVQGEILTTIDSIKYATFKGIRYAKAPVGYLRFKPPVAVDPWTETLNAVHEGADCVQTGSGPTGEKGSEDCLFINVFTPVTNLQSTPAKLKAVMVWIHTGGFASGTASSEFFHPVYILGKDIVYVSLNYRLGALGFLSLNHPNATGNAGLKDQTLALKWVQSNIDRFGGDPKNVTIFGHSAGAACVGYHVLSDASAGLFHGAISMSGVPFNVWAFQSPAEAQTQAERLGTNLGADSTDKETLLQTLYSATTAEIINATSKISYGYLEFTPTLENKNIATDVFLSECSLTKYKTGDYSKVPQLLGFVDQEAMASYSSAESFIETIFFSKNVTRKIGMELPPGLRDFNELLYVVNGSLEEPPANTVDAVINELTDLLFTADIDQTQKLLAANDSMPVYYYHVSFYNNRSLNNFLQEIPLLGPGHADDLPYIFYFPALNFSTDPTDPIARTVNRFTTMWTNFAKYGNPTPNWVEDNDLGVTWPASGPSGTSLDIGNELTVGQRPISTNARLIQSFSEPLLERLHGCDKIFNDL